MAAVLLASVPGRTHARQGEYLQQSVYKNIYTPGDRPPQSIYLYLLALWDKRTIKTILEVERHGVFLSLSWPFVSFMRQIGREGYSTL